MKIEEFFQSLNKDELDEIKNIDKELIESDRESFDNYFVSTYLYKINDYYYCYMSVSDKKDSRSNLLNKKYNDYQKAYEYYNELRILSKGGNLYEIKEKVEK